MRKLPAAIRALPASFEADRYHLAQIPLGQPIHFVQCSLEEALKARQDQQRYLEQLAWRLDGKD